MTNYDDSRKKSYVCFAEEPNGKIRLLNQVQVVYDEGSSGELSCWEQRPRSDDHVVNPSGSGEATFDGIRYFQNGVPDSDIIRIS